MKFNFVIMLCLTTQYKAESPKFPLISPGLGLQTGQLCYCSIQLKPISSTQRQGLFVCIQTRCNFSFKHQAVFMHYCTAPLGWCSTFLLSLLYCFTCSTLASTFDSHCLQSCKQFIFSVGNKNVASYIIT